MAKSVFGTHAARAAYLDAVTASAFGRGYKPIAFDLLGVREGDRVLDVGCGSGDDCRALAKRVGEAGLVVGIDNDREMLEEARARAAEDDRTKFEHGDGLELPFEDDSFDSARADRVFQMTPDRIALLREMIRVTRPGGRIVVSNPGGGSEMDLGQGEDSEAAELTGKIVATGGNEWSGVQLPNLFLEAGLAEIEIHPYVQAWTDAKASDRVTPLAVVARGAIRRGVVSAEEAERWLEHVAEAGRAGRFTFVHTLMIVRGITPEARA